MIKNVFKNLTIRNILKSNLSRNIKSNSQFKLLDSLNQKYFSEQISLESDQKYQNLLKELNFETPEEKDLRYEDQIFFLDRELKQLIRDKKKYGQDYGTQDFPEYQQRELNCLVEIVNNMDSIEKQYFFFKLKQNLETNTDNRLHKQNSINQEFNIEAKFDIGKLNPNNKILDEILVPLIPYLVSDIFVGSGGGSASNNQKMESQEVKQEKIEEKKEV
jgi:hypothetical protein